MIFDPFAALHAPASFRVKYATEPGSVATPPRCAARSSATSRASSRATTATRSTTARIPLVAAVAASASHADEVVGTVRIHEAEPGLWWGSRLAVRRALPPGRAHRRGADPARGVDGPCARLPALPRPRAEPERAAVPAPALAHAGRDRAARPAASPDAGRPRPLPAVRRCRDRLPLAAEEARVHEPGRRLADSPRRLRASRGLRGQARHRGGGGAARLGRAGAAVPVGDDCAAIPDGDGYLLLAIEGFMNEFVAAIRGSPAAAA